MNEETKKALFQKLKLDKPILAMHEEERQITLYLLGGEVLQVEEECPAAQLPFTDLANGKQVHSSATEGSPTRSAAPKRTPRKG